MKEKVTILFLLFFALLTNVVNAEDYGNNLIIPPSNDECSNAISLTVNADFLCGTKTPGTVFEATRSAVVNACTNSLTNADDDVWFKFVATNTSHTINLLNISSTHPTPDLYHAVFNGGLLGDCSALTIGDIVICSDPNSSSLTGLVIGNTYLIRIYTKGTDSQDTTFDICIGTTPMAPNNDDCSSAQNIGAFPFSNSVDASSATNAGFVNVSGCGTAMNDGVWYSFVGDGGDLSFTLKPTGWNAKIAIYSGSCGTFTCAAFSDSGLSGITESLTFTSTVGVTYYINIGHPHSTEDRPEGVFSLDITSSVLSVDELIADGFRYFPNPVKKELKLRARNNINSVAIYNMIGQQVKLIKPSSVAIDVDMSNLSPGVYFVKTDVGEKTGSFKIIKE